MGRTVQVSKTSAGPPPPRSRQRRWSHAGLLALMNGVLAGVSSVYVTTRSVAITAIAAAAVLTLVAMMLRN